MIAKNMSISSNQFLKYADDEDVKSQLGPILVDRSSTQSYTKMLREAPWVIQQKERRDVMDAILADVEDHPHTIEAIAIDSSLKVYPEDFVAAEIRDDGYSLTVSTLDLSSFVPFESSLFYNAIAQGKNLYDRNKGTLIRSMFPGYMIGNLFSTLKSTKTYPTISVTMEFDLMGRPMFEKFKATRSCVKLRNHYTTQGAHTIFSSIGNRNVGALSFEQVTMLIIDAVAATHTNYDPRSEIRILGQLSEVKKLAMGHLGQAIGRAGIPGIWQTTFHHHMFNYLPVENDGEIHQGFTGITPNMIEASRYIQRRNRSKIPFSLTSQAHGYDPSDTRTSFRPDRPLRDSTGFLNGYSVAAFFGIDNAPTIPDLARIMYCRAAELNRDFKTKLNELEQ